MLINGRWAVIWSELIAEKNNCKENFNRKARARLPNVKVFMEILVKT